MDNILHKYTNGNVAVTILSDGTKIREYDDIPNIIHPESMDVKITNYCDNNCPYCHEMSTINGKHADLSILLDVISDLPAGVELAIGGGNPLSHPDLILFLEELKNRGIISNITVNQRHIYQYLDMLQYLIENKMVYGIGVSVVNDDFIYIKELLKLTDNVVFHLIAGVNEVTVIDKILELGKCKFLVLGYKQFGFGIKYFSEEVKENLETWYIELHRYIGKCHLSFDNLALEQLNIKRFLTEQQWSKFYMGDDFTYTMYIDAVKQEFAPTSRSKDRKNFSEYTLLEYFSTFKKQ